MKADYKSMDIEKAVEVWNDERENPGYDKYDDLYIFDNDNNGLSTMFDRMYDILEAAHHGNYDPQDDYVYQYKDCLYSFTYADDVTAPWNMIDD